MVHKKLKRDNGTQEEELRCYICSIEENAEEFERAVRRHWGVENKLHWQLDFTFRDDKNTSMAKTGAKNLQIMKKIVLSILSLVKSSYKLSMKKSVMYCHWIMRMNWKKCCPCWMWLV